MFSTVHDAILLGVAFIYVIVSLVRAITYDTSLNRAMIAQGINPALWLSAPIIMALALFLLAVVW